MAKTRGSWLLKNRIPSRYRTPSHTPTFTSLATHSHSFSLSYSSSSSSSTSRPPSPPKPSPPPRSPLLLPWETAADPRPPFSNADHHGKRGSGAEAVKQKAPITVLAGVPKENIEDRYLVDRELGRGEFGVTYLCIDRDTRELLACKSISKRKLRTAVDVEDVRREVAIMRHLPESPSIVSLREACEDDNAVHLVMELCEGGELFDRIVARGHYTERAAAAVTRTIVEVVQLCHKHGVIHRDLKPENFLFANKKENSPLKAIDFGLSIFFKPGMVEFVLDWWGYCLEDYVGVSDACDVVNLFSDVEIVESVAVMIDQLALSLAVALLVLD
ncbi:hypothetical protein V8G54_018249 [Vigna mungo]|uniref:non-specific serine/threonine protein kinase n=1 Tax=Vigna mungo TaxID=3915 RepID=A0AAQ3NA80_VIGMU